MSRFPCIHLCSLSSLLANWKIGQRNVPVYVLLLSLSAATGGLMFGYDIGISGGVIVMDDFLCQFFPDVLEEKIKRQRTEDIKIQSCTHISPEAWNEREREYRNNNLKRKEELLYCLFGNQKVQLFTSSLYLAAMASTFFAAYVSRQRGRKLTIILAGFFYFVGVVLTITSGSAHYRHYEAFCVLIFGRIMLGFGVGFGNQAIPLFISEIAPADARGSLNHLFQLNVTIGILFANIVNWRAQNLDHWGWRLSFGLGGIPALLLIIGSLFLVETPSSLVQRGLSSQAQHVLNLIRGQGVDANFALQDIITACNGSLPTDNLAQDESLNDSMNGGPSNIQSSKMVLNGLFARSNRPPLVIAIFVQFFQQFTGINVVMLYGPVLFKSFGSKTDASLRFALIISSFNVAFTLFSIFVVDRIGRRRLLIIASIVMLLTQILTGIILIGTNHKESLERWRAIVVLAFICAFVSAFACSWGPLGWLISTEIFPLVCRSEGQSVTVFFNMLFTFLIAHFSLPMLCTLKLAIFFFFALWLAIMSLFSYLFLPETMNMEIEIIIYIWSYHKFWKRFVTFPAPPPRASSMSPYIQPLARSSPMSPYIQSPIRSLHLERL